MLFFAVLLTDLTACVTSLLVPRAELFALRWLRLAALRFRVCSLLSILGG
jgi:hypothetical protein